MVIEVQINRGRLVRRGQWLTPIIAGEGGEAVGGRTRC